MKQIKVMRWAMLLVIGVSFFVSILAVGPQHTVYAAPAAAAPVTNNQGQDLQTCEADGFSLDWVLCPVFNAISHSAQYLFQQIIVPFLKVPPVSTNPKDASFNVWSSFRVYGDLVLVVAIILIVFGEVIGGGVIDAYTARRVLPRILVATILVNLSVYIVAGLVDITNILGNGIGDILIAPFKDNAALNFSLSGNQIAGVFGIGFLGLFATGGAVSVVLLALWGSFGTVAFMALLSVIPIIITILSVFVTLIFRQGIILFLVMVSPIAFALYCLPNTERVFKRWWDFLMEALMVYPIVIIIFAVADILSATILQANNVNLTGSAGQSATTSIVKEPLASITAFALQFAPLVLIPFAFRIASDTLGRIHEGITRGGGAVNSMLQSRNENQKRKYDSAKTTARGRVLDKYQGRRDNYAQTANNPNVSGARRRIARGRQWLVDSAIVNRVSGSNPQAAESQEQAKWNEIIQAQTATGPDGMVRGLTVNKAGALRTADGDLWRTKTDSQGNQVREFKSAGGQWISEADVDKADGEFKGNKYAFQAALSYEMGKAQLQPDIDNLVTTYADTARSKGMTDTEAAAAWTGAAYGNQGNNLQYKYMKWQRDGATDQHGLQMNGLGLMQEMDERIGSGQMAGQKADTFTTMTQAVVDARQTVKNSITPERAVEIDGQLRRGDLSGAAQREAEQDLNKTRVTGQAMKDAQETLQRATRIANNLNSTRGVAAGTDAGTIARSRAARQMPPNLEGADEAVPGGISYAPGRVQEEQDAFIKTALEGIERNVSAPPKGIDNRDTRRR
jgi:hypothetical protein